MSLVCSDYEVKLSLLAKNGQDKDTRRTTANRNFFSAQLITEAPQLCVALERLKAGAHTKQMNQPGDEQHWIRYQMRKIKTPSPDHSG